MAHPTNGFEYWHALARSSLPGATGEHYAEVARRCERIESDGGMPDIWHESAALMSRPCNCARCKRAA